MELKNNLNNIQEGRKRENKTENKNKMKPKHTNSYTKCKSSENIS